MINNNQYDKKKSIESIILNIINQCKFKINTAESERMDTTTVFHTRSAKKFSLRIIRGGGGCTKAGWRRHAGKFGLGRKFYAIFIYAILSRYLELSRSKHFLGKFGQKSFFCCQKQCFLGKKSTISWYILHIILN